ncbi:hypothetical protein [Microbacterium sp. SD291]|uniref:hypothetical protein n=1 Tax=Microbacterium sp. SD291 TaxID=2782007 RepID=UPI001A961438|nr:hypothetical protein [Microbacterium sp. SD291]MBO0981196.1 hypothetical protein [Microbacterium sp. SD291]
MNSEQNTPQPDPAAETQRFDTVAEADPAAAPEQPAMGRRRRNILIGAAAAVALVAVGGGAYAVGAAVADDDDDRPSISEGSGPGADGHGDRDDRDDRGDDRDDDSRGGDRDDDRDDRGDGVNGGGTAAGAPATDAAALREAAEAAIAAADGTGASKIDVEHGGYEVEVLLADGEEIDVFVAADGTATPEAAQDDDRSSDPALDLKELDAIIDAALAASESEGAVDSVASSDDDGVAYEVSIRLSDGRDADIELAADLSLVHADIDD